MDSTYIRNKRKSIVFMLFLYMVINFADKAVLGIVSTFIMQDLNLSASEYGLIASSFFFFFFISGIVFGFLSNQFSTKWIIALLVFIWSVTQLPIVFWPSFWVLLICRILLGIGEGPAYPVAIHALYKWFPDQQRNRVTAIIAQGGPVGIVCAAPLLAWFTESYGWKNTFLCLSLIGAIWLIFWWSISKEGPLDQYAITTTDTSKPMVVSYKKLILNRSILGVAFLSFAAYWILALLLTWLPTYLILGFGVSLLNMSIWMAAIVLITIPMSLGGAAFSQYLFNKGYSTRYSRAVLVSVFVFLGGLCTFLAVTNGQGKLGIFFLLALGFAFPNLAFSLGPTIIAEIVPAQQRGALLAIVHSIATSAGVISPLVTGWMIDRASMPLAGYTQAYLLAASLLCIAGMLGYVLIQPAQTRQKIIANQKANSDIGHIPLP